MDRFEYIFGRDSLNGTETLRVKGPEHTDLKGFQDVTREYDDSTIADSFMVVEKTHSAEDGEGNCYDWYTIDKHFRTIDRTKKVDAQMAQLEGTMEYLAMMADIELPEEEQEGRTNE